MVKIGGKSGAEKNRKSNRTDRSSGNSLPPVEKCGGEPSCHESLSKPAGQISQPDPGLYIIATPIGNARDITLRALDILNACDVLVCEDTRMTAKLLAIHNIRKPLIAYHEHNAERAGPAIIKRLQQGEIVALVSDAGTPLISDPGYRLVRACAEEALYVTHLPGPSSVLTSLVLAGLPTDRFLFAGFPPTKSGKRVSFYDEFKTTPATLVFLESPKRLAKSLADMIGVFGPRDAVVGRELTKKFEEIRRGPIEELANHYQEAGAPKGEVTIVVSPPEEGGGVASGEEIDALLLKALRNSSLKDAVAAVVSATGAVKREVYARALEMDSRHK
jgi:16S rRNA (cytidine1402-2'-O)-methyltransferase